MAVVEGIRTPVILDLTDIAGSVAQLKKEFKRLERIAGGTRLALDGKEIKSLNEKGLKPAIKNFTIMADKAKRAAENVRSIDKAIKQMQASKFKAGGAQQLGGFMQSKSAIKAAHDAAQATTRAEGAAGTKGYRAAQEKALKAQRTAISLLRKEKMAWQQVVNERMKYVEISSSPKLNVIQRHIVQRAQHVKSLRKEWASLYILHKKGLMTKKDLIRADRVHKQMAEAKLKPLRKSVELQQQAAKAAREAQASQAGGGMMGGGLFSGGRAMWFLQLRAFWGVYRGITEAIEGLKEKDEAMARSLRTSKVGPTLKNRTEIVKAYSAAINDMASAYGVSFKEAGEALYQLGSAGLNADESLAALNSTMQLLVGTEGDAQETTKAVASIYNNFGDTMTNQITLSEKMVHINSTLANTWKDHQVEIGELTQGMALSSQMAVTVGVSFEKLTAMLGVLNTHMIKSGRAGRSLQNIWARISKAPMEFAHTFGIALDPTKPLKFTEIMETLSKRMKDGSMNVAQIGDMFTRMGLRGAPAFAALVKNWDEVGKAMETNLKKGSETLDQLEEDMTTHFNKAAERFSMNFKVVMEEAFGAVRDMARDTMNWISDYMETGNLRKEWQKMRGDEATMEAGGYGTEGEKGYKPGKMMTPEDIGRLKHMLEIFKKKGGYDREILQIEAKIVSLEQTKTRMGRQQSQQRAMAVAKKKEEAKLTKAEVIYNKEQLRIKMMMAEITTDKNVDKKYALAKKQHAEEKKTLKYYLEQMQGIEGESGIILKQQKKTATAAAAVAALEKIIYKRFEKKVKLQEDFIKLELKRKEAKQQIADAEEKTEVMAGGKDSTHYIDMQREAALAELELEREKNAIKLEDDELAYQLMLAKRTELLEQWRLQDKEKETAFNYEQVQAKHGMYQGGGGMGQGMLGAHADYQNKSIAADKAETKMKETGDLKDVERYKQAQKEKYAAGVETGRATLAMGVDMLYQMAQENKKMFKFYQAAAIAETIMSTSQAIMQAYAQAGPYLGTAFAVMIGAMGAMKIAQIAKQKPPEYAQGGVIQSRRNQSAAYATGGVTSTAAVAMLGDNASGRELVIPAEHIDDEQTSGYTRESGGATIINVVTSEDIAAAMQETEGQEVVVNAIGSDMRQRKSTYKNIRDVNRGNS